MNCKENERVLRCALIRHGQTPGNKEKRYIGCRSDEPLSEEGVQALEAAMDIKKQGFNASGFCGLKGGHEKLTAECVSETNEGDLIFVSPMLRARQTADILFSGRKKIIINKLMEMDFGLFEGKNYMELSGDPDYQRWIDSGGTTPFPGGEDPEDFRRRSFEGFEDAVKLALENNCDQIRIVAHGGTVMSVMSRLSGGTYFDFMVNCAEGYDLSIKILEEGYDLLSYNRFYNRNNS